MLCLGQVKFWPPESAPFLLILDSIPGDQRDICFRAVASGFMVRDLCPAFVRCCPNLARRLYRVCRRSISMYASHRRLQTFCVSLSSMRSLAINGEDSTVTPQSMLQVSRLCAASIVGPVESYKKQYNRIRRKKRLYSPANSYEWN